MLWATLNLIVASAAFAQAEPAARTGASQTTPEQKHTTTQAEDLLRTLRQRRPGNEVIPPGSSRDPASTPPAATDRARLLPEGSSWVEQTGQLERDGDWWVFRPVSGDATTSIRMLPNANLESMVRSLRGASSGSRFTISGELTVFERRSYVIIRSAMRGTVESTQPSQPAPPAPRPSTIAPAGAVLEQMQALEPTDTTLSSEESPTAAAPAALGGRLLLDGAAVVRRVGRLSRQESWWIFASDSDHSDSVDTPMRLLPNQALEMMVKDSQAGGATSYTVSGEATLFFGENYLLPRVATRKIDLGNLRK